PSPGSGESTFTTGAGGAIRPPPRIHRHGSIAAKQRETTHAHLPFPPEAHLRKAVKERRLPRAGRTAVAARDEEGGRAHRPVAQGRVAEPGAAAVVRARRGEVAGVPAPLHGGAEV